MSGGVLTSTLVLSVLGCAGSVSPSAVATEPPAAVEAAGALETPEQAAATAQAAEPKKEARRAKPDAQNRKSSNKTLGSSGPVVAELKLEHAQAAGDDVKGRAKTRGTLELTSNGKTKSVKLINSAGTCKEITPATFGKGDRQTEAMWSIDCTNGDKSREYHIVQKGRTLTVIAKPGPKGKGMSTLREIPLAKNADIRRKG